MGDCRQIGPVVKYGGMSETIAASLLHSHLWQRFEIFEFSENMRLTALRSNTVSRDVFERESAFAANLLTIGNGGHDDTHAQVISADSTQGIKVLRLPLIKATPSIQTAMDFIHPGGVLSENLHKRMILAGTNKAVAEWNAAVQALNPNETTTYLASNMFDECDDPHGYIRSMVTPSTLAKYESNQIPPHALNLKVGDVCIILRTLRLQETVATNTMVKILPLGPDSSGKTLKIQVLNSSRTFLLPRIRFKCKLRFNTSYTLHRIQFPLRLAYSLTFNKSQGQTLDKVVMDLRMPVFSHGLLYVGNSRVQSSNDLLYLLKEEDITDTVPTTANVVYPQLLLNLPDHQTVPAAAYGIALPPTAVHEGIAAASSSCPAVTAPAKDLYDSDLDSLSDNSDPYAYAGNSDYESD